MSNDEWLESRTSVEDKQKSRSKDEIIYFEGIYFKGEDLLVNFPGKMKKP